jgi:hypothetical protein
MRSVKRNIPIIAAVFASVAAMSVAAVAQSGDAPSPGEGVPQVTTVEADAQRAMDVLDTARTSSDAMPADVAESLDDHAKFGMNPDLSRESINTIANDVYVIPADDHICSSLTVGDGANLSCAETSDVAAGQVGASTVTLEGGGIAIYGIVPDGVESVTVKTGTSTSTSVATDENAYFTVVPKGTPLRTVGYTGPSGVVEFPIYDPAVVFDEE